MSRSRVISSRLRHRVIVTLKSGASFAGVLYSHDAEALVLREAEALGAGDRGVNLPLDGEWIAMLDNIDYMQRA